MELLLIVVTVLSSVTVLMVGLFAWRLSRDEQSRSAARIAALAIAANGPAKPELQTEWSFEPETDEPVGHERQAFRPAVIVAERDPARVNWNFGSALSPQRRGVRPAHGIAIGLILTLMAAVGFWISSRPATPAIAVASTNTPLELVTLNHERRGSQLAIRGVLRNPISGHPQDRLHAVVSLLDQHGALLSNGQAVIVADTLVPGQDSPFLVTLEAAPAVSRYRVSFRNDSGVVSHLDRRDQRVVARGLP